MAGPFDFGDFSHSAPPGNYDARNGKRYSAQHERKHEDVPERAIFVEPGEVQTVQAVIEPAVPARERDVAVDDLAGLEVEVRCRAVR